MASTRLPILGAGESGVGAARLALLHDFVPCVSDAGKGVDSKRHELEILGIECEFNGHSSETILKDAHALGWLIKSPGIPEDNPLIEALRSKNIEVISEIEFASRFARKQNEQVVAITGANGKTTTTALVAALLQDAGKDVACVGNIGKSWARDLAERENPAAHQVVEVSSFQLDGITSFRPNIAILLNITPDHLDRYGDDIGRYADAKWRITAFQTPDDFLILNAEDDLSIERWKSSEKQHGTRARVVAVSTRKTLNSLRKNLQKQGLHPWGVAGVDQSKQPQRFTIHIPHQKPFTMTIQELALQGKHNLYNSMAASVAARVLDLRSEGIRESLKQFDAIEHRMEFVKEVNQIKFINDSKATNVNSTWFALESMRGPVIWIAGGVDKGNDYSSLMHLVTNKVDHLICLGKNNEKLLATFGDRVQSIHEVEDASVAVQLAYDLGMPGHSVLLSPACASFDLFGSYEERGHAFKKAVKGL
tara:strand:+ start:265 stop:1701 length:1437 start_codon:yes stop_codon:yes gene_type:complete